MARSGSYDFGVTRDEIVNAALRLLGVLGLDQTASTTMLSEGGEALNFMIKSWQGRGYGLWLNKELVLFPQADTVKYYIGPDADTGYGSFCIPYDVYVKTEIATAAAAAAGTVTVDSSTGINDSDWIGIETANGDIHWTTVNGAPAGNVITLTAALDYATAVDSHVYSGFDTTQIAQRPLDIIHAWRRDGNELDVDIDIEALDVYRSQSNKTTEAAAVTMLAFDKQLDEAVVYLWPEPNDMKYRIHLVAKYPVQDFDASTNNPDFPPEWYMALKYNLALHLSAEYSRAPNSLVVKLAKDSIADAIGSDTENVSLKLQPNLRSYRRR